jgi:multicomponent Na+:H+ antiporter subunit E
MKLIYLIDFIFYYFRDLIRGAFKVANDVVTPKDLSSPGIIKVPLLATTDFEIALLSNLVTFSPGSMVVDIDKDRSHLYIHLMFLSDKDEAIKDFKENFEQRVLRILR